MYIALGLEIEKAEMPLLGKLPKIEGFRYQLLGCQGQDGTGDLLDVSADTFI